MLQDCVALLELNFFLMVCRPTDLCVRIRVVCRPTDLCVRIRKSFVDVFLSLGYTGFVCVAAFFFWTTYSKQSSV